MQDLLPTAAIEQAVRRAFHQDVMSLKPGNVHRYAAGHDMTMDDFLASADASVPWLLDSRLSAGQRIYGAARATREATGCNTNLGMLLLFTPLIMAVEKPARENLQERVKKVLQLLDDLEDAENFYAAIREASPGGLGRTEEHDVAQTATVSIMEAMCAAQQRDRVAYQYASGYTDIFSKPLNVLNLYKERWQSIEWALVACYLSFLTQFSDSHITRKYGEPVARQVRKQGGQILTRFTAYKNPEEAAPLLFEFDTQLKAEGINPGTSADLAAACMLASDLNDLLAG